MFVGVLVTPPQMKQQSFYTLHWGRSSSLHVVVLKFFKKNLWKTSLFFPYFTKKYVDDHLHALAQNIYERLCMHRKVYRATKKKFVFEDFFKKLFCSHSEIKYKVEKIPEAVTRTTASEILTQGFSSNNFFFCSTPPDDSVWSVASSGQVLHWNWEWKSNRANVCSKSTIETVKKVLNIFKVNNEKTRTRSTYFTPFSSVSIATLNK